jgi:phasin protein
MHTASTERFAAFKFDANAFMTLSNIAFSSLKRFTALNLSATRAFFEGGIATYVSMPPNKDIKERQNLWGTTSETATNNAIEYFHHVQKIAAETQSEVAKVMTSLFSPNGEALNKSLDSFKSSAHQMSATMETNSKAAGDAMEASSKAVGDVAESNAKAVDAATERMASAASHSKKSA